ncbi:MAG: cyanophycinase, partial [Gammaproteobacteria bacterium]
GGTPVAKLIRSLNANGVHVAGTSAGAAIMSEHMIAGGASGPTPRENGVTMAPGLGLTNKIIIDQHFSQRDRIGRLMTALSYNPFISGIGIDENTAAFIDPDGLLEVLGSGAITVLDPDELSHSSMANTLHQEPITLIGMKLHILASGARYDINTREAYSER